MPLLLLLEEEPSPDCQPLAPRPQEEKGLRRGGHRLRTFLILKTPSLPLLLLLQLRTPLLPTANRATRTPVRALQQPQQQPQHQEKAAEAEAEASWMVIMTVVVVMMAEPYTFLVVQHGSTRP